LAERYGFVPTVVERSATLRLGGYPVDVRGDAVEIAKRMGIWSRLQQEMTTLDAIDFVNKHSQRISGINVLTLRKLLDLDQNWAEVMRGDISKIVYEETQQEVEYIFGDSIQALQPGLRGGRCDL